MEGFVTTIIPDCEGGERIYKAFCSFKLTPPHSNFIVYEGFFGMPIMAAIRLKAHFDGKHITLDEPHELQPGMAVTVTVVADAGDQETLDHDRAASESLERAYSENEPEYTARDVKP